LRKNEAWAVVWPDKRVAGNSLSYRKKEAIERFLAVFVGHTWKELERDWNVRVAKVRLVIEE